jgi:mannose-6-phosphate isomerase
MDPLVFEPYLRPQVWGGRGLGQYLGKALPEEGNFGESWEISDQPLHVSRVAEGPLQGALLTEIWAEHSAELSGHRPASPPERFPLLIKYLDCRELLSIQVHPNDELAAEWTQGDSGKTEAWVVIQADPAARIYAGLRPGTTREDLERRLDDGTLPECLHSFVPRRGDCIFLKAGTVHAVGGGVVLAEVQQSSDATFRLWDWDRVGVEGKPRPLHRQEALASIDWTVGPVNPVQPVEPRSTPEIPRGVRGEGLVACRYFFLNRFHLGQAMEVPFPKQLSIWMLLEGEAQLSCESGYTRRLRQGETVLVPASASAPRWALAGADRNAILLRVVVP